MRRVTKKLLLFIFGVLFTVFYCEFLIYYVVIVQCRWPELYTEINLDPVRVLILADPHLLGPRKSLWFDRWRREWQMHRAFQTILTSHQADAVFILGDIFDEGQFSNDKQFKGFVERFHKTFSVPDSVALYITVGNHDIGFHNHMKKGAHHRFANTMNSSSVQFITLKENHFVLINSMAMEGDSCNMCKEARRRIEDISTMLFCSEELNCTSDLRGVNNSRPVLMQHFPLYRKSDAVCKELYTDLSNNRKKPIYKEKIDALSKDATEYLITRIKPRAVFGGHTHRSCFIRHSRKDAGIDFDEYSVASFSWRNRPDPKYMLVTFSPSEYAVNECGLPLETTIAFTAIALLFTITCYIIKWRPLGR